MSGQKNWVKIADDISEIPFDSNHMAEVRAGEKTICLARYQGQYFAVAAKCPHASGRICEGWIDVLGQVVCPLHRYKFSLKNGRNVSGEGYFLKNWPVELRPDGVYIGLDAPKLFGLF